MMYPPQIGRAWMRPIVCAGCGGIAEPTAFWSVRGRASTRVSPSTVSNRRSQEPANCGLWRAERNLSPTAFRALLMRLVRVVSDTIRPPQIEAMRSSLLATRSLLQ